jgi:hypothetical protein
MSNQEERLDESDPGPVPEEAEKPDPELLWRAQVRAAVAGWNELELRQLVFAYLCGMPVTLHALPGTDEKGDPTVFIEQRVGPEPVLRVDARTAGFKIEVESPTEIAATVEGYAARPEPEVKQEAIPADRPGQYL